MCRAIETAGPLQSHALFQSESFKDFAPAPNPNLRYASNLKPQFVVQSIPSISFVPVSNHSEIEIGGLCDFPNLQFNPTEDIKEEVNDEMFKFDGEFDNTELSILYSFLLDEHGQPLQFRKPTPAADSGVLSVNLLDTSPLDSMFQTINLPKLDSSMGMNSTLLPFEAPPCNVPLSSPALQVEAPPNLKVVKKDRRLCKIEDCMKRSRSHGLCIGHGGGRRCAVENCNKSSQAGDFCIRHGGGKRCSFDGCEKAAQSNSLCKSHGGGPRCCVDGCEKSSQGGGYCRFHGGGKRCAYSGCEKGTQRGDFCALHGGSRLCKVEGCQRNDRGGGLCASHGGGKRCVIPGCERPCRRQGRCSAHCRVDVLRT